MDKQKIENFKNKLTKELNLLEEELKTVGRINPSNPNDWEPVAPELGLDTADKNETADEIEGYETNAGILKSLEIQMNAVKGALRRMEEGTYGTCSSCGKQIEEDRLEANPSAETCKACMGK